MSLKLNISITLQVLPTSDENANQPRERSSTVRELKGSMHLDLNNVSSNSLSSGLPDGDSVSSLASLATATPGSITPQWNHVGPFDDLDGGNDESASGVFMKILFFFLQSWVFGMAQTFSVQSKSVCTFI